MRYLYFILLIGVLSCSKVPENVKLALEKAGDNKKELQKVIDHYSNGGDDLKLEAAYFLIGNMEGEGFQYAPVVDKYNIVFDILENKSEEWKESQPWYSNAIQLMIDSLRQEYNLPGNPNLNNYIDLQVLDSKFIISNIDEAFEAWQKPWCNHLTFEQFCEYILPYRTFGERPEYWRQMFKDKYSYIVDSITDKNDVIEVGHFLNQKAMPYFSTAFDRFPVSIAPGNMLRSHFGNCSNNANYKVLAMRSMGVPAVLDFIPIYGNNKNKHFWNATIDNHGNPISFEEPFKDPNSEVIFLPKFTLTKVYRKTYAHQEDKEEWLESTNGNVPPGLKDTKYIDVTNEYLAVSDVMYELKNKPDWAKYVYICVFDNTGWLPVHYGKIRDDGKVVFTKMGRNVVYLPVYYKDNKLAPAGEPFLLTKKGWVKRFETDETDKQQLAITRKYNMVKRKDNWQNCLIGGKFQGANRADFKDAKTIHTIRSKPSQYMESVNVQKTGSYRYFRFVWDVDTNNIDGEYDGTCIAEVQFYDKKGNLLTGVPVTLPGQEHIVYPPENTFDGKALTFYEDRRDTTGKFIGIDLGVGNKSGVGQIKFQSRNDMNSIQPGDEYELLYWKGNGYTSLGRQVATDTVLKYEGPKDALYWLRNLSGGSEERVFTYENGKQVWW